MNLTFKGFLRLYVRELTGLETDNLRKLCRAVASDSPHAAEALMSFAGSQGKAGYLASLAAGTWMEGEYKRVAREIEGYGCVEAFLQSDAVTSRYRKVWNAFVARRDAIQADRRVVSLMRAKTIDAMRGAGLTAYRLCRDLGLNEGNVYAYLNGGDVTKVSRQTARRIMEYATAWV